MGGDADADYGRGAGDARSGTGGDEEEDWRLFSSESLGFFNAG